MSHTETLAIWLLVAAAQGSVAAAAEVRMPLGRQHVSVKVQSWREIRDDHLVRQTWDVSCGAAALSTILSRDFGANHSELAIAVSILANTDPGRVRARGGFSLLDLKRYAEAVGFEAEGYGGMSLADLDEAARPAILPVRIHGLDHFVVFRERLAGKVLIGDPAFGNLLLDEGQFRGIWQSGVALLVHPKESGERRYERLSLDRMRLSVPNLNDVYRISRAGSTLPPVR